MKTSLNQTCGYSAEHSLFQVKDAAKDLKEKAEAKIKEARAA